MSDEQDLKLACLHQAGGNLDHAKSLFDWVSGSVRATPASEAPAVSAPNQDKPEQPFNYQHPSKYGTDVPRRCYLKELTPEERAIRDLVDAIEHLGAHPLLTTTVIQLMKAGESLADWVDIGLRDKAIAALTSEPETHTGNGGEEFLLDEGRRETSPVQSASDQDKARRVESPTEWLGSLTFRASPSPEPPSPEVASEQGAAAFDPKATMFPSDYTTGPAIPEGFIPWSGGECPVDFDATVEMILESYSSPVTAKYATSYNWSGDWDTDDGVDPPTAVAPVRAYRIIKPSADAERTAADSQSTEQDRVDQASYAPLNEDEGLMWANGFEADAKMKAEEPEAKRPFWMFSKKGLA